MGGNCCSNEDNIDIQGQLEGVLLTAGMKPKGNYYNSNPNSGLATQQRATYDIRKILEMPKTSKEYQELVSMVTKVNALMRGHVQRLIYKKLRLLNLITGKKAHQFSKSDIQNVPISRVQVVNSRE